MLTCPEAVKKMHAHMDGDLPDEENIQLKEHMDKCESCQDHFRQLQKTIAVFQYETPAEKAEIEMSDFCKRIMQNLPKSKWFKRLYLLVRRYPYRSLAMFGGLFLLLAWLLSIDTENKLVVKIPDIDSVTVNGKQVQVPAQTIIHGDVYIANGEIEIAGTINGDLVIMNGKYRLADSADINGEIREIDHSYERWIIKIQEWFE